MTTRRDRVRRASALVWPAAAVTLCAVTLWLELTHPVRDLGGELLGSPGWVTGVQSVFFAGAAAAILWRGPHPLGWALGAAGLFWAADGVAESFCRVALGSDDAWQGTSGALWFTLRFGAFLPVTLSLLLLLFPTGRFLPGRWGLAGKVAVAVMTVHSLAFVVIPFDRVDTETALPPGVDPDPTTVDALAPVAAALLPTYAIAMAACFVVVLGSVATRHRRARGIERDRMRWLLWSVLVMVVTVVAWILLRRQGPATAVLIAGFNTPAVAMAIAVVRPTLLRVDELLTRTLVFVALSTSVVAVDLGALAVLGKLLGDRLADRQVLVVVLLLSVLVYNPLRLLLLGWVRRLVLGDRDQPYDAVAGLAATLESTDASGAQLSAVADAVARAFGVGYVSVEVDRPHGERIEVTVGERPEHTRTLPISFRGAQVGRLVLPAAGIRAPLGRTDERLLGDLVRQAASAAMATQLAVELQEDRERLVTAREEELRRIRRDLHDGLGPSLGGAVFQLESARLLVDTDPALALAQLVATRAHLQDVVVDVRRLVHDLRPPALDDLGLVGAVRQLAQQDAGSPGTTTTVRAGDGLGDLPAAVEVAAYRIVGEALTNVRRHAGATRCTVSLTLGDDAVVVEVADDGVGISADAQAGIGLMSLRERAAELGGDTEVRCPPEGGTVVRARLPLPAPTTGAGTDNPTSPTTEGAFA